jgi:hypothetical protein
MQLFNVKTLWFIQCLVRLDRVNIPNAWKCNVMLPSKFRQTSWQWWDVSGLPYVPPEQEIKYKVRVTRWHSVRCVCTIYLRRHFRFSVKVRRPSSLLEKWVYVTRTVFFQIWQEECLISAWKRYSYRCLLRTLRNEVRLLCLQILRYGPPNLTVKSRETSSSFLLVGVPSWLG